MRGIQNHDHWIPFRSCLSYLAISSTRTQSRLCTDLRSFEQFNPLFSVRINLWSFPESVTTFTKIEISHIYKFLFEILYSFVKFANMFFSRLTSAVICIFKIFNYFRHAKLFRAKVLWYFYTFIQLFYYLTKIISLLFYRLYISLFLIDMTVFSFSKTWFRKCICSDLQLYFFPACLSLYDFLWMQIHISHTFPHKLKYLEILKKLWVTLYCLHFYLSTPNI